MKIRKKPVTVDGWLIGDLMKQAAHDPRTLPKPVREAMLVTLIFCDGGLYVETLEGRMFGSEAAWLIRGVEGEFYPCDPAIFASTYDIIEPTDTGLPLPPTPTIDPYGKSPEL